MEAMILLIERGGSHDLHPCLPAHGRDYGSETPTGVRHLFGRSAEADGGLRGHGPIPYEIRPPMRWIASKSSSGRRKKAMRLSPGVKINISLPCQPCRQQGSPVAEISNFWL
jgi:hypothetical protein